MNIQSLRDGKPAFGTMLRMIADPNIALIVRNAGLDFLMLDMEHSAYSFDTAAGIFGMANAAGIGAFVRVPELTRGNVSRALDCGATGVMVPMIETVAQASDLVRWGKFTPVGGRGLSTAGGHTAYRSLGSPTQVMEHCNRETLTIAQIETRLGVENVESIAALDGIDVLLVGPSDLAVSLGCADEKNAPQWVAAIDRVAAAAKAHGKIFGLHAAKEVLNRWAPKGLCFAMSAHDLSILLAGMKKVNEEARAALA